jgi:hypothetical protein
MALAALNEFSGYDRKPVKTGCDWSAERVLTRFFLLDADFNRWR